MAKRNRNLPPMPWQGRRAEFESDPVRSAQARRLLGMLVGNSVLILSVYFILNALQFGAIFFIYMGISTVLILIYVIYNRGFVYKNVTPEMLPSSMAAEEKERILRDARERMDRSRWMLTLILPFVLAFMLDALYLFILSDILANSGLFQ